MVSQIIERMGVTHLLDYGSGAQCNLARHLKVPHKVTYQAYDPGVERFSRPPLPAQLVCCIDVLEHIEPEYLESALDELARLTEAIGFFTITTAAAKKSLPDGRNAHLTQQPLQWWLPKLWDRFDIQSVQFMTEDSFLVVCQAKSRLEMPNGEKLI